MSLCEVVKSEDARKWEASIQEEYDSLMANGMWALTMFPIDHKSIECKWVFHTKRDVLGQIVRHKTRLVAKGYSEIVGVDFNEILVIVTKFIIRCIFTIGVPWIGRSTKWRRFFNGEFKVEIYMNQPKVESQHVSCDMSTKFPFT